MMLKEDKSLQESSDALAKHVSLFAQDGFFSPSTVSTGLKLLHSSNTYLKGKAIAGFNSGHGGHCPFGTTEFKEYAPFLHMGTTRIWKKDGTIDETRWDQLVQLASCEHDCGSILLKSKLMDYLDHCFKVDLSEIDTGRKADSIFSSASVQRTAAVEAWKEVYNLIASGSIKDDPYITLDQARLFFEDSGKAFEPAKTGELPVKKLGEEEPKIEMGLSI